MNDSLEVQKHRVSIIEARQLEHGAKVLREMEERAGGDWQTSSTRFPVPELYQFYDLRGPSRRLQ